MRRRPYVCILSAALMGVGVAAFAQAANEHPRVIAFEDGVPIQSRLLPSDRIVIVQRKPSEGHLDFPVSDLTAEEYAAIVAGGPDRAAVIVEFTDIRGEPTEDRSWIRTVLTATPVRIVYSHIDTVSRGRSILIVDNNGGQIRLGDCDVKAGLVPNIQRGRSYLVFIGRKTDGTVIPTANYFAIDRGRIVDTSRALKPAGVRLSFDNERLSTVIELIRQAVRNKPQQ